MLYNTETYINWIEEAISKKHIIYYEYEHFKNIQEIGNDNIVKIYRANWKNWKQYFMLKSISNLDDIAIKELVHELQLYRKVNFGDNLINFYGITVSNQVIQNDKIKKYLLVMDYVDGDTLENYLRKNFNNLSWKNKFNLAYQLVRAVSYLHREGIAHHDLHSGSILVHQNTIKLVDFGLSKRIKEASYKRKYGAFGRIPYIDPKKFKESFPLDEKSDVYSIGVLLWEISSGKSPFHAFYVEGGSYENFLAVRILQGLREDVIPNTPADYAKLYTECWNGEPNNRPSMIDVLERLENQEKMRELYLIIVNKTTDFICEITSNGILGSYYILDYFDDNNINSREIYNWLSNNQDDVNSIFLLGYFNYCGVETNSNHEKAFNLFLNASEKNHLLAQSFLGKCYQYGIGTVKDEKLAFEYFKSLANKNFVLGQVDVGYCYSQGKGTKKDVKMAIYWYEKAVNDGNIIAMNNLAHKYKNGDGVQKDCNKAFELFKKSAEGGYLSGMKMMAYCYNNGVGTNIDKQKAYEITRQVTYKESLNNKSKRIKS